MMDTSLYANAAQAQGKPYSGETISQPVMSEMIQRAAVVNERLALAADRLSRFLDRCHGPRPEGSGEKALQAIPSGHFDAFGDQFRSIEASLGQLENIADALDRIG